MKSRVGPHADDQVSSLRQIGIRTLRETRELHYGVLRASAGASAAPTPADTGTTGATPATPAATPAAPGFTGAVPTPGGQGQPVAGQPEVASRTSSAR